MSTKKKAPAEKEETRVEEAQEAQPVEKEASVQEETQEEQKDSEEKVIRESKSERVIVILSKSDSEFLSQFSLPRSSVSRAVLRGTKEFLSQFVEKKDATEQEIVDALQGVGSGYV